MRLYSGNNSRVISPATIFRIGRISVGSSANQIARVGYFYDKCKKVTSKDYLFMEHISLILCSCTF